MMDYEEYFDKYYPEANVPEFRQQLKEEYSKLSREELEARLQEIEVKYLQSQFDEYNKIAYSRDVELGKNRKERQVKEKGAQKTNQKKQQRVARRQAKIKKYLSTHPDPDTKALTLEGHLNKALELGVSERTIKNDLKTISEKR